jgi:hypothetical protein
MELNRDFTYEKPPADKYDYPPCGLLPALFEDIEPSLGVTQQTGKIGHGLIMFVFCLQHNRTISLSYFAGLSTSAL